MHLNDAPTHPKGRIRGRIRLFVGGACALVLVAASAVLSGPAQAAVTSNQTGTNNGYFYSFWTDSPGSVSMELGAGGTTAPPGRTPGISSPVRAGAPAGAGA